MPPVLKTLAFATFLVLAYVTRDAYTGNRSIPQLTDLPEPPDEDLPPLSVIVAARNEEKRIERAVTSMLHQDYPDLEVLVVDDRSTDRTGAILQQLPAPPDHHLELIRVTDLPSGWLGKNHALHLGACQAGGRLFLFTDADVMMRPGTVRRAVGHLRRTGADHLAVVPEVRVPGRWLPMVVGTFATLFSIYVRPWQVSQPDSGRHIGIGAFNLLRREAYEAIGTHRAIALRPDDDMKLGKLVKRHGLRQEVAFGRGMVHVRWYDSVRELIDGLAKNAFADADYQVAKMLGSSLLVAGLYIWPYAALVATRGSTRWLNAGSVLLLVFLFRDTARFHALGRWYGAMLPVPAGILLYAMWNSMLRALWQDGITWRGTHYPLAALRSNIV
jgi:glycosyltransferase involved in cell wall biosynthesis